MIHLVAFWLLVAGFIGAGLVNVIGTKATRRDFARWGFPRHWGLVTGALEILSAVLIAVPATRIAGLGLGTLIILAAIGTVVRHRDWSHLAPLGVFVALLAAVQMSF